MGTEKSTYSWSLSKYVTSVCSENRKQWCTVSCGVTVLLSEDIDCLLPWVTLAPLRAAGVKEIVLRRFDDGVWILSLRMTVFTEGQDSGKVLCFSGELGRCAEVRDRDSGMCLSNMSQRFSGSGAAEPFSRGNRFEWGKRGLWIRNQVGTGDGRG